MPFRVLSQRSFPRCLVDPFLKNKEDGNHTGTREQNQC
jgi:hypothetical protein